MRQVWTAICHLRARSTERERWIGGRSEAMGRLLLVTGDRSDIRERLTDSLLHQGYDLVEASDIVELERAVLTPQERAEAERLRLRLTANHPIPLGPFQVIATPENQWVETDWEHLLAAPDPLWAVIDGVSWPEFAGASWKDQEECVCLYDTLNPTSRASAPWLIRVRLGSPILTPLKNRAPLRHGYVLFRTARSVAEIRRHCRRYTMLTIPGSDVPVYFRFYDPRVLLDISASMTSEFQRQFFAPFREAAVQLSPLCLLPSGTRLHGDRPTPFDDENACRGRFLAMNVSDLPSKDSPVRTGALRVKETEFERLSERMIERSQLKLARRLHFDHPDFSREDCLRVSRLAQGLAARFDMTTVKQVAVIARAILIAGEGFESRDPEARAILFNTNLLPWQRKDRLTAWLSRILLQTPLSQQDMARTIA